MVADGPQGHDVRCTAISALRPSVAVWPRTRQDQETDPGGGVCRSRPVSPFSHSIRCQEADYQSRTSPQIPQRRNEHGHKQGASALPAGRDGVLCSVITRIETMKERT